MINLSIYRSLSFFVHGNNCHKFVIATTAATRKSLSAFSPTLGFTIEKSSQTPTPPQQPRVVELFARESVQERLRRMVSIYPEQVLCEQNRKVQNTRFMFATDAQLADYRQEAVRQASGRTYAMPPYMEAEDSNRQEMTALANDPELDGHDTSTFMFTDISDWWQPERYRMVVARQPDGQLRLASLDEHDRIMRAYFKKEYRTVKMQHMFTDDEQQQLIEAPLERNHHHFIMDRACQQLEPDDPTYIRIRNRVFDDVVDRRKFQLLDGTRYFGPLCFHIAYRRRGVERLFGYFLRDYRRRPDVFRRCFDFMAIFYTIHPVPPELLEGLTAVVKDEAAVSDWFVKLVTEPDIIDQVNEEVMLELLLAFAHHESSVERRDRVEMELLRTRELLQSNANNVAIKDM